MNCRFGAAKNGTTPFYQHRPVRGTLHGQTADRNFRLRTPLLTVARTRQRVASRSLTQPPSLLLLLLVLLLRQHHALVSYSWIRAVNDVTIQQCLMRTDLRSRHNLPIDIRRESASISKDYVVCIRHVAFAHLLCESRDADSRQRRPRRIVVAETIRANSLASNAAGQFAVSIAEERRAGSYRRSQHVGI